MASGRLSKVKGKVVDIPTAPTIGTATAGGESASTTFTNSTVGGPYRSYIAKSDPSNITATGSTSPINVTGLTAGTSYTISVAGINETGTGEYSSASNSVTPTVNTAYESIATTTLSSSQATITFSSIPATFTHLQIRALVTGTNATQTGSTSFQLNGDTGSNYTRHQLGGGGATAFAYAATAETKGHVYGYNDNLNNVVPMSFVMDILDYANTSKYKTTRILSGSDRNGTPPYGDINLISSLWLNTNAITSLSIFIGGQNIGQYSSFALYGIKGA